MRRHHPSHPSDDSRQNIATEGASRATRNGFRRSHGLPLLHATTTPASRLTSAMRFLHVWDSRQWILLFIAFSIVVLLWIHMYLFRLVTSSEPHHHHDAISMGETVVAVAIASSTVPRRRRQEQDMVTLSQLQSHGLTPLREIDYEKYTIRINTWMRNEQLLISVLHHSSCEGVAQIQVVWCDPLHEPPEELRELPKVVVERHAVNTLNERFHVLTETPTLGILSIDDDVLRPCEAMDAGFFKWTHHPERMVGFDARIHVEGDSGTWSYGYLSATEKLNRYSLSLPRYAFFHRDYLDSYYHSSPRSIFDMVSKNFNCEDIAMSFWVSSLTDGKPPLLADMWALQSQLKLYAPSRISAHSDHKKLRDECVDKFATQLQLKGKLQTAPVAHPKHYWFQAGAPVEEPASLSIPGVERYEEFKKTIHNLKHMGSKERNIEFAKMKDRAGRLAYKEGLIEKTKPWAKRWQSHSR